MTEENPAVALVEYFALNNGVLACWCWRHGAAAPELYAPDVALSDLQALVERSPWLAKAEDPQAQDLLSALVRPVLEFAREEDLLWIVPWGPLHQLPLHAARLADGRVLLERHPVCYSPSASVMKVCRARRRGAYRNAIVLGDAEEDLADARAESQFVAARFATQARVGAQATLTALDALLTGAGPTLDVLHLACHGAFDADDPARSGLQLAGAEPAAAWLSAEAVRERRIGAELVVLSACVSGRTRVYEGDEPSGLVRSFLFAGAAAVLASLWRVDDLSTRLLVQGFYEALLAAVPAAPGQSARPRRWHKAQALRQAALELRARPLSDWLARLDSADGARLQALAEEAGVSATQPMFDASFHWAPFMLVGDWG